MKKNIELEKFTGEDKQIRILYDLLESREFNISHNYQPSIKEHREFSLRNPYRTWFLIKNNGEYIGSTYIQDNNSIGFNINEPSISIVRYCLDFLLTNFKPLDVIKSVRPNYFFVNVPYSNIQMREVLNSLYEKPIQVSYKL